MGSTVARYSTLGPSSTTTTSAEAACGASIAPAATAKGARDARTRLRNMRALFLRGLHGVGDGRVGVIEVGAQVKG
jgi:hypothetical protein